MGHLPRLRRVALHQLQDTILIQLSYVPAHIGQVVGPLHKSVRLVDDDGKAHVGKELGKATVTAKLLGEQKGDKVRIFKYRPKSGYARRQGHRQMYTMVEIQDVKLGGRSGAKKAGPKAEEKPEQAEAAVEGADAKSEKAAVTAEAEPEAATPNPGQPEEAQPEAGRT